MKLNHCIGLFRYECSNLLYLKKIAIVFRLKDLQTNVFKGSLINKVYCFLEELLVDCTVLGRVTRHADPSVCEHTVLYCLYTYVYVHVPICPLSGPFQSSHKLAGFSSHNEHILSDAAVWKRVVRLGQ